MYVFAVDKSPAMEDVDDCDRADVSNSSPPGDKCRKEIEQERAHEECERPNEIQDEVVRARPS